MPDPASPRQAIRYLGRMADRQGPDAVAAYLAARRVTGETNDPCRCALSEGLAAACPGYEFYVNADSQVFYRAAPNPSPDYPTDLSDPLAAGWHRVLIGPALDTFVNRFDDGLYPALVAAETPA
jgi:hypothetical protein